MKAFITHCTSAVSAPKSRPIAGKATLSTEPSMKARLEARMQVVEDQRRIFRLAAFGREAVPLGEPVGEGETQAGSPIGPQRGLGP